MLQPDTNLFVEGRCVQRKTTHVVILSWLLITLVLYVWHAVGGAERILRVPFSSEWVSFVDDRSQGGTSESTLSVSPNRIHLQCQLKKTSAWPFCEIKIDLEKWQEKGLDLSRYRAVGINLDLRSPTPNERVRVYLRNFNTQYSTPVDPVSMKFNAVEYSPTVSEGLRRVALSTFQVLSWWIADYKIPVEASLVELDDVRWIEIATGSHVNEGNYELTLKQLEFYGEWISQTELFQWLLGSWVLLAVLWLLAESRQLRRHLRRSTEETTQWQQAALEFQQTALLQAEQAQRDPLTGAYNRYGLSVWLETQPTTPVDQMTLLYLDLDHFKSINDTHGHEAGDAVLRQFCQLVQALATEEMRLIRWGGEEFLLFCPNIDAQAGRQFAETLRQSVIRSVWCEGISVTVSIGIAEWQGEEFSCWIARADKALYQAKSEGRNCCVLG